MENHEAELYIFGPDDQLITTITEETGLYAAPFKEGINQMSSFKFIVDATTEAAVHVIEENQVVFRDKEGDFRLFVIKEPTDRDGPDGPETEAVCEPWYMELKEHIVLDRRFVDQTADVALNAFLEGTRATGRVIGELGLATTNFYRLPAIDAIWELPKVWGGELKDVVEFDGSRITERRIELHMRRGADRGKVFEIDHDIEEIERNVLAYPLTAMYGWGASLEIEDEQGEHTGGYTRYIDFADVEWSVAKGDPVDKPKGQKWVGDPEALKRYGRLHIGKRLHREGQYSNQDIEDPAALLEATWLHLQDVKEPEVNYRLSVALLERLAGYEHEHVQLGDTAAAIDREFSREIVVQSRVISIEYDILDIEGTAVVEMGQFLSVHDQNLGREIDDLKAELDDTRAQANRPITNDRFLDIEPGTPSNLQAVGGFQVIQLYWNYDSNVNIAHYEVYGSQVASFVPDAQHLLWRGRTSAFAHEVHTDETWYYYVRAVNQRGTPGDYSVRASAATVRLISDDLLFGAVTAEHLAGNLDIADKLAQNTVDRINAGPMKEIGYTRDEISAAETRLNTRLSNEVGDVNGAISTLTGRADALSKRADAVDTSLIGHGNRLTEVETDIDTVNGKISASLTNIERIDDTVNQHTATLSAQATAIAAKVDNLTYQRDMSGAISRIDSAETNLGILASGLELRVTRDEFESLQVGGRNLLPNSLGGFELKPKNTGASSDNYNYYRFYVDLKVGQEYTISADVEITAGEFDAITIYRGYPGGTSGSIPIPPDGRVKFTFTNTSEHADSILMYAGRAGATRGNGVIFRRVKIEKGNRPTDWTPAPEDTDAAITSVSNRVTNTETTLQVHAGQISAKAERTEVYTKTEINTALGKKVDTTVYNTKMGQLDVSINGITGRVASTETNINTLTGQMQTATSNIAALDVRADGIVQSVSNVRSELNTRITSAEASIKTLAGEIELRATKTSVDSIAGRMSTAEGRINVLSDEIDLRVTKNGIIAGINITPESIRINGAKIHLTGQTLIDDAIIGTAALANLSVSRAKIQTAAVGTLQVEDGSITNAKIASLSADKINAGAIRGIDIYGSKFRSADGLTDLEIAGGNVRLTQSNGNRVEVNPNGLFGYNANGSLRFNLDSTWVSTSAVATTSTNVYLAARPSGLTGEARVVNYDDIPGDGLASSYRYLPLRASGFYGNYVNVNTAVSGSPVNLYLRPLSGGEVRVTLNETTGNYQSLRADVLYANVLENNILHGASSHMYVRPRSDGELRVTAGQTTDNYLPVRASGFLGTYVDLDAVGNPQAAHLYLRPSGSPGEVRITVRGTTSTYRPIRAREFITDTSVRETKADIEVFKDSTLDVFRNARVYTYKRKTDEPLASRQLGLMIDEMPAVTYSEAGDSFALYGLTSYAIKGIKELIGVTDNHEKRINWLELENQYLKQKIKALECA